MRRSQLAAWVGWAVLTATPALAQITESPVTVAPGRFLLEVDAFTLSLDEDAGNQYTAVGAGLAFLSTGLTANLDVQLGAELFLSQEFNVSGLTERHSGIGDVYFRTKWRFFESTSTYTSVALMPYVKFPTNSGGVGNDTVEGGLIVPFESQLVGGFLLTGMGQVDYVRNDDDNGYDTRWLAALAMQRPITRTLGLYGELTLGKSAGGGSWEGLLGGGVTWAMTKNLTWDYALYTGIASGSADWSGALRLNWGF